MSATIVWGTVLSEARAVFEVLEVLVAFGVLEVLDGAGALEALDGADALDAFEAFEALGMLDVRAAFASCVVLCCVCSAVAQLRSKLPAIKASTRSAITAAPAITASP